MANEVTYREVFTPQFSEFITLYRGVERVWISGAPMLSPEDEGRDGILFAEMEDGVIQTLGPVSGFFYAQKNGFTGTFEEWVQTLIDATTNALTSEAYAKGTKNGTAVGSSDPAYKKNSLYYSQSSESWAVGTRNGGTDSERSGASTNNAKYWAEDRAKKWAIKSSNTGSPSNTNCAEYYAEQAQTSVSTAAQWATGGTSGTPSSTNNAKKYSENSNTSALASEGYANGTQNGTAVSSGTYYHNNSKYWSQQSATSATNASTSLGAAIQAQTAAETARNNAQTSESNSEAWAVGKRSGTDVPSSDVTFHNNSKYYSEQSANSATASAASALNSSNSANDALSYRNTSQSAMRDAQDYADAASRSSTSSLNYSRDAEAWAIGKRNGADVPNSDDTYHNNSKYYSTLARSYANEIENVTVTTTYQNSSSGMVIPTGTWVNTPSPQEGKYMWAKTVMQWYENYSSTIYTVSYIGINGDGSVDSVNGLGGDVMLYATNISMSEQDNTSIYTHLQPITNAQIDTLFA